MKKLFFTLAFFATVSLGAIAQTKKDGTPDMRYKANKEAYGNTTPSPSYTPSVPSSPTPSYSTPKTEKNYENGGQLKIQEGYMKSNGTYVEPHLKTTPDNSKTNNKSSWDPK